MALVKQPITINFQQGLDTKTDPWQVKPGKFLSLQNSIFTKAGLLQKRNGFGEITSLPDDTYTYLTTFGGGLTAIGENLSSFSSSTDSWYTKGVLNPLDLNVLPLVRNNFNQQYADSAIAANGLICTSYVENNAGTLTLKYTVVDSGTGQVVVAPSILTGTGVPTYAPRVFYLYPYFIIVFDNIISSVNHLQFIAISVTNPTNVVGPTDISTQYVPASTGTFDGVVVGSNLYIVYNGNSSTIRAAYVTNTLAVTSSTSFSGSASTISVCSDTSTGFNTIWASWIDSSGNVNALAFNPQINQILAPTAIASSTGAVNIASYAQNGLLTVFYEVAHNYGYDSAVPSHYIVSNSLTQGGTAGSPSTVVRSVGLASKVFLYNGVYYFFSLYVSPYQPTYFLVNQYGNVISRFAYENGPTYYVNGLSSVSVNGSAVQFPYLYKDLIQAVNKGTNLVSGTQVNGIYSQTGVNFLTIAFGTSSLNTSEIGGNLNISGGFISMYDGVSPVEQSFFLYPDSVEASTATGSGGLIAQQYYYQFTYEWTDNQGNAFRSAPSIPITITTTTSSSTNTLSVPTLRLTEKVASPVKIVGYRWSAAQEEYYQFTSITAPTVNSTTSDYVTIVDTSSDTTILGNNLIYTTGGVIEDVAPPASSIMTLFNNRLWLVDSEDRNLLWFSKEVIEATPVEMSDLLTQYVAPTTAAEGSTGDISSLAAMDDKLIIGKQNAFYYINGIGPDNTGANNGYSDAIFITSSVGCTNQNSIVLIPTGLMFQSNKGIWLLDRNLNTSYIGEAVEQFNSATVLSAVNIPNQNQVRFTLNNGVTLMYDYFYGQWSTFTNVPAVSSTIFEGMHTFINVFGQAFQESEGVYLDGSSPVLMSFTTSWFNLNGIQGYERIYFIYLLANYITPHFLNVQIAYDYNPSNTQSSIIYPSNYNVPYGGDQTYGLSTPYGGSPTLEQWEVHMQTQRTQAFQVTVSEQFDPRYGTIAGAGFTMSGITCMVGMKKGWRPVNPANSIG